MSNLHQEVSIVTSESDYFVILRVICDFESQASLPEGVAKYELLFTVLCTEEPYSSAESCSLGLEQCHLLFNQGRDEPKMLTKPAHYFLVLRVMLRGICS